MSSWFHVFFSTSFSKLWLDDNVQSGLSGPIRCVSKAPPSCPHMVTLEWGKSTSCVGVRAGCLFCGLQNQFFRPRVQSAGSLGGFCVSVTLFILQTCFQVQGDRMWVHHSTVISAGRRLTEATDPSRVCLDWCVLSALIPPARCRPSRPPALKHRAAPCRALIRD